MKISNYRAKNHEANFGKPIFSQVGGGTHITFELITVRGSKFYMTRWPHGLPRHEDPPDTLRFPHGLIQFGESLREMSSRLVREQLGMKIKKVEIAYWDSYVDDSNHWHIEPGLIVHVDGKPTTPEGASEVVKFDLKSIPKMTYWSKKEFLDVVRDKLPQLLK